MQHQTNVFLGDASPPLGPCFDLEVVLDSVFQLTTQRKQEIPVLNYLNLQTLLSQGIGSQQT